MNGLSVGPLLLSAERLALVAGVAVLVLAGEWLGRRTDRRFASWAPATLAAALLGARAGYVLEHATDFAAAPWRALAIWDGGLSWPWGAAPAALATVLILRRPRLIGVAAAVLAVCIPLTALLVRLGGRVDPKPLPAVALQTIDGKVLSVADTRGRPTVINLWATWCPPCQRELPMLAQAAAEHPEVRFIFADQAEPPATVREHLARKGLSMPIVALDTDQALAHYYAAAGLPATLFVRSDGRLQAAHLGQISRDTLEAELSALKP